MYRFILASASPRRRELLPLVGIDFDVVPSSCPEHTDKTEPCAAVTDIAEQKCRDVFSQLSKSGRLCENTVIISADTSVVLDGKIFGKPKDDSDARGMLSALSGKTHEVYTGLCIYYKNNFHCLYERTRVTFCELSARQTEEYIASGEPRDKAGAYGIQGLGAKFVKKIDGDFFNIVGLPVCALYNFLISLLPEFSDK